MEYLWKQGIKVSLAALGTAQFGFRYGIANKTGRPQEKEIEKILCTAFTNGINLLDTAYSYGESEKIIGRILSRYSAEHRFLVASKLPKLKYADDSKMLVKEIEQKLADSMHNLQVDHIPIYLLHDENDMTANQGYALDILAKQREKGNLGLVGVSIYTPGAAQLALENPQIQVIQVPFNVFDQRLNYNKFFQKAAEKEKLIIVRSVFLQGLFFLLENDSYPEQFAEYSWYFNKLQNLAQDSCLKVSELAFWYAAQKTQGVILFGVDSCNQLKENLKYISTYKELSPSTIAEIERDFCTVPLDLIDPRQWKERR